MKVSWSSHAGERATNRIARSPESSLALDRPASFFLFGWVAQIRKCQAGYLIVIRGDLMKNLDLGDCLTMFHPEPLAGRG